MDVSGYLNLMVTIAAGGVATVSSGMLLRQRASADKTKRAEDAAKSEFIEGLIAERDAAREEARKDRVLREKDMKRLAMIEADKDSQLFSPNR